MDEYKPRLAKWYQNKQAAVSLRFDDSRESHVKIAIPALNQYGFKATFMVNPGKKSYLKHQKFWEQELPKMEHRFGNHTMNHEGASTLEEANYEIGEVSRLIWRLFPDQSKLTVFASGGGGLLWGGEYWENAGKEYKDLLEKYHLIDLYDGKHPSKSVRSSDTIENLCQLLSTAIDKNSHAAVHFHEIGTPRVRERLRKMLSGYSYTVETGIFRSFLKCLYDLKDEIWVAPLVEILKYETEYHSAELTVSDRNNDSLHLSLKIDTDVQLYDRKLTLVIPLKKRQKINSITQNGKPLIVSFQNDKRIMVNIHPVKSRIIINLN